MLTFMMKSYNVKDAGRINSLCQYISYIFISLLCFSVGKVTFYKCKKCVLKGFLHRKTNYYSVCFGLKKLEFCSLVEKLTFQQCQVLAYLKLQRALFVVRAAYRVIYLSPITPSTPQLKSHHPCPPTHALSTAVHFMFFILQFQQLMTLNTNRFIVN